MVYVRRCLAVLTAGFLLPYIVTVFWGSWFARESQTGAWEEARAEVQEEKLQVQIGQVLYEMTEEEYLLGAMAAAVPMNDESETLKAVAVILRTNLYAMKEKGQPILPEENCFIEEYARARTWGVDTYLEYQRRGKQAIEETRGITLKWEGKLLEAAFHSVSAGTTREGAYPYLASVDSQADRRSEQFLTVYWFSGKTLSALFPEITEEQWRQLSFVEEGKTSYIKEVSAGEAVIPGEEFREKLSLCSGAYFGSWKENGLQILCKGQGHGLGFSVFGANELAKEGRSWQELLTYYYGNITIENE